MAQQRLRHLGDKAGVVAHDLRDGVDHVQLRDANVIRERLDEREHLALGFRLVAAERLQEVVALLEQIAAPRVLGGVRVLLGGVVQGGAARRIPLERKPQNVDHGRVQAPVEHHVLVRFHDLNEVVRGRGQVVCHPPEEVARLLVGSLLVCEEVLSQRREGLDDVERLAVDLHCRRVHHNLDEFEVVGDACALRHVPHHQRARLGGEVGVLEAHQADHGLDERV
mmetsp:Transcript_35335/g.83668  ORF Transcript_35335/g.83668 Transcript_35335/m.83668 type:complete len:224 (-) Transcript_35335:217-888(-)